MAQRYLINARGVRGRRRRFNPPHPGSYGAAYPLTFGEGIGGRRRPVRIEKETRAERAAYDRVKGLRPSLAPRSGPRHASGTRRASPAQVRARKAFAAMARKRAATARKARSAGAKTTTPRRSGGSRMATRRKKRSRKGSRRRPAARRRRSGARRRRSPVIHVLSRGAYAVNRKRRRRGRARVNRHRRYRRNPGLGGGRGIMGMVVQGFKDGFMVTVGRGLTNLAASKIPFGQTSAISQGAVQLAVGTGLALGIKKFTRSDRAAAFFLAGAYSGVISKVLTPMLPASLQPLLGGGVGTYYRMPATVASYPRIAAPAAGRRPSNAPGMGSAWDSAEGGFSDGMMS